MDDRVFDEPGAREWISCVEGQRPRPRDRDIQPRLRAWLRTLGPGEVLEIGAGQGTCCEEVGGLRYTGVEPSTHLVERARALYGAPNLRFVVGNAYAPPFADGAFHAAFSVLVWHLLSDLGTAAREMARVLEPGGRFLIVTAAPDAYAEWERHSAGDTLRRHTLDELKEALRVAGLEVTAAESIREGLLLCLSGAKKDG